MRKSERLDGSIGEANTESLQWVSFTTQAGLDRPQCFGDIRVEDGGHVCRPPRELDRFVRSLIGVHPHIAERGAHWRDELVELAHREAGLGSRLLREIKYLLRGFPEDDLDRVDRF